MSTFIATIKAGTIFAFTRGEYSDYRIEGVYVAREEIESVTLREIEGQLSEWKKAEEEKGEYVDDLNNRFIAELIRRELIIDARCREIWLGGYGDLDLEERAQL